MLHAFKRDEHVFACLCAREMELLFLSVMQSVCRVRAVHCGATPDLHARECNFVWSYVCVCACFSARIHTVVECMYVCIQSCMCLCVHVNEYT